ncbi:MAG: GyrI-like domain-containing protein [Cyclobacteriaceae bacterium]
MEMTIQKLDLKKEYAQYYNASIKPQKLMVEEDKFLSLSGMGAPEDALFQRSIETIYPVAFTVKKFYKQQGMDFIVPKLECFWWVESELPFEETPRTEWFWELIIRMPEFVDTAKVDEAIGEVIKKKNISLANEVYLKKMEEGFSVQAMHIGSYENEKPTIDKMFEFMEEENLEMVGKHHEIYISDPRKIPEERLKTVLRYAVKSIDS